MTKPGKQHKLREWMDKLQAENKALKETLDKTTDLVVDYQERMVKIKKSRDDLLEILRFTLRHHALYYDADLLKQAIQKAEALKEGGDALTK